MDTERIALSQRERERLRVLHEVKQKQITQIEAARRLKVSDRHIRRLLPVRSTNWGSNGSRRTVPRRKDGSSDCSKLCRTAC